MSQKLTGMLIDEDGQRWIQLDDGKDVWEEPIAGWEYVINFTDVTLPGAFFRHEKSGRIAKEI